MDRLFGFTMAERGISQLVSVSLAEAEKSQRSNLGRWHGRRFGATRRLLENPARHNARGHFSHSKISLFMTVVFLDTQKGRTYGSAAFDAP